MTAWGLRRFQLIKFSVRKGVGKVGQVNSSLNLAGMDGFIGIGHTRWATHGGVTDYNAHPHPCCNNNIAVIYNGIIENYLSLKEKTSKEGAHIPVRQIPKSSLICLKTITILAEISSAQ